MVDYPHSTRAKKFFLVLMVGPSMVSMPQVGSVFWQISIHKNANKHLSTLHTLTSCLLPGSMVIRIWGWGGGVKLS